MRLPTTCVRAQAHLAAGVGAGPGLDVSRLLPAAPPLEMQLAQAQAQSRGSHDDGGNGGQASLPVWADRFAMQWQRGQGGGGVAPWMQERVAQVTRRWPKVALGGTDVRG